MTAKSEKISTPRIVAFIVFVGFIIALVLVINRERRQALAHDAQKQNIKQ